MGGRSGSVGLAGVLLAFPSAASAQREPGLRQVKVPHTYCYRERLGAHLSPTGRYLVLPCSVRIPARRSGWYLLRARGNGPTYPVLDFYPYATTSPIYVTVGGEPIRSILDADYFLAWIDRPGRVALAHRDWNTEQERENALRSIVEFQRRRTR